MNSKKRKRGQVVRFPEGTVEVINYDAPTMVWVSQALLEHRADPGFWNPKWAEYQNYRPEILHRLGDYIVHLTYGPIVTRIKPQSLGRWQDGVLIVGQRELTDIYLDLTEADIVEEGSQWDSPRARLAYRDILFPRSGVGSLGKYRFGVWLDNDPTHRAVVSCFVDLVRLDLERIFPEYVVVYLKSRFGRMQIDRAISGVGTINIDYDDIRSLLFHAVDIFHQERVAQEYRQIIDLYNQAIRLRSIGQPAQAERLFGIAEGMMNTLIGQVELLIEGKQDCIFPLMPADTSGKLRALLEREYQLLSKASESVLEEDTTQDPLQASVIRLIQLLEGLQGKG